MDIETIEKVKPNPEVIALTKRVLDQNDIILRMNGQLLNMLSSPLLFIKSSTVNNQINPS